MGVNNTIRMTCYVCDGRGYILAPDSSSLYDGWDDPIWEEITCDECGGTGKAQEDEI